MNRPYSHPSALDRAVLHTINQAILLTSVDGVIVQFNHAAEKMFGFRADEVVGKITPVAFYDPLSLSDQASRLSSELGYLVKAGFEVLVAQARLGATTESEWSFTRKDGSRFPGHSSVTALRDQGGEIIGFLAVVDDISEKRRVDAVTRELIAQRSDSLAELQRRAEELVALNELLSLIHI